MSDKNDQREEQMSLQSEEITRDYPRPSDDSNMEDSELVEQGT